jgi:hypothetical protein
MAAMIHAEANLLSQVNVPSLNPPLPARTAPDFAVIVISEATQAAVNP